MWQFCAKANADTDATPGRDSRGRNRNRNSRNRPQYANSRGCYRGTPTEAPTATFTATPVPGTALAVGQPARVVAPDGLNMRDQPSSAGQLLLLLPSNQRVTVVGRAD